MNFNKHSELIGQHAFLGASRFGWLNYDDEKLIQSYVNDAIAYRLTPEQPLYFSRNCFGTADAISFNERSRFLRIHDLKTGVTIAHMEQLEIYAALFCLEYKVQPTEIGMELRIYQNNEIVTHEPKGEDIKCIMQKIIAFDGKIEKIRAEE